MHDQELCGERYDLGTGQDCGISDGNNAKYNGLCQHQTVLGSKTKNHVRYGVLTVTKV